MRLFAFISTVVLSITIVALWQIKGDTDAELAAISGPLTGAAPGEGRTLRAEGQIAATPAPVRGLDGEPGCVATFTRLNYVWVERVDVGHGSERKYEDRRYARTLFERRAGADPIPVRVENGVVLVPLAHWPAHQQGIVRRSQALPEWSAELELAPAPEHEGVFMHYEIRDACLRPGDSVFVRGQVSQVAGAEALAGIVDDEQLARASDEDARVLRVLPGPGSARIELFPGSQAELVAARGEVADDTNTWFYVAVALQVGVIILLLASEIMRRDPAASGDS